MRRVPLGLVPVLAIWAAAATALAIPARRVVDWFWMTDELLYERLAFSVVKTGSPLPSLHGQRVPVTNFLYPLLLAAVSGWHYVPSFLPRAHTLNAVLMTSAAVPAYLLARSMLRSQLAAYAASLLTVLVPWMILASFLLTESAAYPAFVWAVYLMQRAIARPSVPADLLALAGLVVAVLTRTQLVVLFAVPLIAILVRERGLRRAVDRHRALAAVTAAGIVALVVLVAAGHGAGLLGSYAGTTHGSWISVAMARGLTQHAAVVAMGLGFLPGIVGAAWLSVRSLRIEVAPLVASLAGLLVLLEATSFDVRFGGDLPHDRYLFYLAPILLIGLLGALEDRHLPRWSLVGPLAVVLIGLATAVLPLYDKFNVETPVSIVDNYLLRTGGGLNGARLTLIGCALLALAIFVLARLFLPHRFAAVLVTAVVAAFLFGETAYGFDRLFSVYGTSGRPITVSQGSIFDWVDRAIGPTADVTMITYGQIPGDYNATAGFWWDLEFWNRSVTRAVYVDSKFAEIQSTFPRVALGFDPRTGRANQSPTQYVAQSDSDARFGVRGKIVTIARNVRLVDAGPAWRLDWRTYGLDDDGFTLPGRQTSLRVYPAAGQSKPTLRFVQFLVLAGPAPESATFTSSTGSWTAQVAASAEATAQTTVCVPPTGYGTIHIAPHGTATVYGDQGTKAGIGGNRIRGVQVERVSEADETGSC
jgi:hypothetical protein